MRLYVAPLTLFLFLLFQGFSHAQTKSIAAAEAQAHKARLAFVPSPLTSNYDLVYQRAEWTVDPAVRYIKGAITSHLKPIKSGVDQIWFDLDNALIVDSVYYHSRKIPFTQTEEELLRLDLPAALTENVLDSVTVFYQGVPPTTGHGSFEQRLHNQAPIIWTLSEPYGARDWWPCKQSLTDKIDSIDILVKVPLGNKVASNGILVKEEQQDQQLLYHWKHRYPIVTYLVAIAATNYVAFSNKVPYQDQNIEVLNYVYPESAAVLKPQSESIVGMMQLFNELFGLYPFAKEKYGHAQFSWGGGMEHQTMSFMGSFNYDLMAHELAHQWFGYKVTCGSWHDIWVNEGFATYLTGLTKEHLSTPDVWRAWKASKIASVTSDAGGSVWVPDTTNVNRIFSSRLSYNKGAYLLHMLRWVVGDDAFYTGIRNYLDDPKLAYGFATATDVKRHLEASSGKDLSEFFEDWYYGEGYPIYSLAYEQHDNLLSVKISQASSAADAVDFFEMPVPVLFRNANGSQEKLVVFDHNSQEQIFDVEVPFEVAEVVFDPELWLLTRNPTISRGITGLEDEIARKIKLYPNPSSSRLTINTSGGLTIGEIILLNQQGQQIQKFNARNKDSFEINLKKIPAATYLLRIKTNKGWATKRFSVQ